MWKAFLHPIHQTEKPPLTQYNCKQKVFKNLAQKIWL